jgi:hypothetical protein
VVARGQSQKALSLFMGDRGFESCSLQRGVGCEPVGGRGRAASEPPYREAVAATSACGKKWSSADGPDVADERLSVEDAIGLIAVQIETCRPISTTASTGNLK